MKIKNVLGYTLILTILTINCKEKNQTNADQLHGTITFLRGTVDLNGNSPKIGQIVAGKDKITTKENSSAVIQFSTSAIITLESNTSVEIVKLMQGDENGKPAIDIAQNNGSTFNKIVPGKADYRIHTPTITAGVRGTSFSVETTSDKESSIRLFKGKVALQKPADIDMTNTAEGKVAEEPEIILEAGNKISVKNDVIEKPVTMETKELEKLEKLNEIALLPKENIEKIESASKESEKQMEEVQKEIPVVVPVETQKALNIEVKVPETEKKEAPAASAPKEITLDDLRKKYGKLSKISTNDGRTFIGYFNQVGGSMEIMTTKGKVTINVSQIEKIASYDN